MMMMMMMMMMRERPRSEHRGCNHVMLENEFKAQERTRSREEEPGAAPDVKRTQ